MPCIFECGLNVVNPQLLLINQYFVRLAHVFGLCIIMTRFLSGTQFEGEASCLQRTSIHLYALARFKTVHWGHRLSVLLRS